LPIARRFISGGAEIMSKIIVTLLIVFCLALPSVSHAQSATSPLEKRSEEIFGMSQDNVLTIGAGIILGALALHWVVPTDLTILAGGVLGGYAANWWYHNGGDTRVRALLKPSVGQQALMAGDVAQPRPIALVQ
jgi:hypothetical protein